MEKKVLEWSPELATYAWCLKGGDCLFVGVVGFCWGATTLIVHTTLFDGGIFHSTCLEWSDRRAGRWRP